MTLTCKAISFGLSPPVISTPRGILALHEPFAFQTATGAALVLGGVALTQRAG